MSDSMIETLKKGAREVLFAAISAVITYIQVQVVPTLPVEYTSGLFAIVWVVLGMIDKWIHEQKTGIFKDVPGISPI